MSERQLGASCLLQLVEVVGAAVVNIVAEASRHHGHSFQICVVALQLARLRCDTEIERERERGEDRENYSVFKW